MPQTVFDDLPDETKKKTGSVFDDLPDESKANTAPVAPAASAGHPASRGFLDNLWEGAKGVGESLAAPFTAAAELSKLSPFSSEGNQLKRAKEMLVDPVLEQQQKARTEIASGHPLYGVQRAVIGSVPMVGPGIMDVSDKIVDPETRARGVGNAVGFALPYGMPKAGKIVAPELQQAAESQYQRALRPTKEKTKILAKKLAPEAIDRGLTGGIDSLHQQATTGLDQAGQQLSAAHQTVAAQQPTVIASIQPIMGTLDKLRDRSVTNGVPTDLSRIKAIDQFKTMLTDIAKNDANGGPQDVSYESLMKARQDLDRQVSDFHVQPNQQSDLMVTKRTADAIRHELAQASPDVAKINAEYSFWKNFHRVVDATQMRTTSQAPGILGWMAAVGGGAGMFAHSGSLEHAALTAATVKGIQKLVMSPAWKTTSAVAKSRLADILASGDQGAADAFIGAQLAGSGMGHPAQNSQQ